MTDRIVLTGLEFWALHGVYEHEKATAQRFEVDLEVELDLAPAANLDDLALTVDYGAMAERVRAVMAGPPVDLLETLAERIAGAVLADFERVRAVVVRVRKPDVELVVPMAFTGVEIRRAR